MSRKKTSPPQGYRGKKGKQDLGENDRGSDFQALAGIIGKKSN